MKKIIFAVVLCVISAGLFAQGYTIRDKNEVNEFDRVFMTQYNKPMDYISTALEITSLAMPLVCFMAPGEDHLEIGIQYAETMAVAVGLRFLFKGTVERARPYMYFEGAPEKEIANGD